MSKYVLRVKGRHIWNPSNFGISVMLFLAAGDRRQPEHSVGKLFVADAGDLGAGLGHYLAAASAFISPASMSCRFWRSHFCELDDRQSVAVGGCAHHRTDVSALHLLHDHRSEDHGAIEDRTMLVVFLVALVEMVMRLEPDRLRSVLRAVHGWPDRHADRNLDGFAPREQHCDSTA